MKLTSIEIRNKDFAKGFRGFVCEEVEYFLEDMAIAWDELQRQYAESAQRIADLESRLSRYTAVETTMQETLVQSRQTGEGIVDGAQARARAVVEEAEKTAAELVERSRSELTRLQEQYIVLKAKKDLLATRLKTLLGSELELIKSLEAGEEVSNDAGQAGGPLTKEIEDIIRNLDAT